MNCKYDLFKKLKQFIYIQNINREMKRAVQKVQLLKNMTKIFAEGNYQVTVKNILNGLSNQNEQDMQYLEKQMLKIFPICSKIQRYLRSQDKFHLFIKQFQVELHNEKDVIFCMGEVGRKMYFILDGNLNIFPYEINEIILVPGDYFGEVSLHHRLPRTATIVCASNAVLLIINYEAYYNFLQPVIDHQIAVQYYQLKPTALFYGWNELALALIIHHLKLITILRNQYVYKEGQNDRSFYVVKSGEILIQQKIKVKGKLQDYGLVSLGIGQCFGDYEFIDNQSWYSNRNQLENIKRTTDAISTTVSEIYQVPLFQYLQIAENYHSLLFKKYLKQNKLILTQRILQLQERIQKIDNSEEYDNPENLHIPQFKPKSSNPYQNLLNTIRNRKIIPQQQQQQELREEIESDTNIKQLKKKIQNYFYQPSNLQQQLKKNEQTQSLSSRNNNTRLPLKPRENKNDKANYLKKLYAMRNKLLAQTSYGNSNNIDTQKTQVLNQNQQTNLFQQQFQSLNIHSYKNSRTVTPSPSYVIKTPNQNYSERKYEFHNVHIVKSKSQSSFQLHKQENYPVKKIIMEVRNQKKSSLGCLITQL
ncbi:unnamed protein product [Paramecium sonneborni]|uniref:Cyclic nucleotide-binding domain-containing protein n=1 Tax=Paramecium sonneborni TaxID=65129 RepID=A0A8S1QHH8_9CILI|nr:unnamed protein product [Paramecium sonneborni]